MGVFDDVSHFLETRLEEFLRNNPHLELQALQEQLQEQAQDTQRLFISLQQQKQAQERDLLSLAQDIQAWHGRVAKANQAGRVDLAQAAQEREAALLRQGNQLWGQMEGTRKRLVQTQELLTQIQQKQKEVQVRTEQMKTEQAKASTSSTDSDTTGWNQASEYSRYKRDLDPLEAEFKRWELDEELDALKRNVGRS